MESITQFLTRLLDAGGSLTIFEALGAFAIAYLGGVLSSLTPCIYPMIPITVSVVGGGAHAGGKRSLKEVAIRGAAYVSGMTVTYSFLGVLAGITGRVFGTFTNTPGWYIGLGAVMTVAALIMLDILPFDPAVWWERFRRGVLKKEPHTVHHHTKEMTFLGVFMLGASSGFIAAPCTTPVLTSILAYIAKTQSVGLGLGLMAAFSLGLGTLLMLIAVFAGSLQMLPRSGQWMKTIKTASGVLLLVFAQYLIYRAGKLGGI